MLIDEAFRIAGRRKVSEEFSNNQNMFMNMYPSVPNQMYMNTLYNYQHNYSQPFIPGPIQIQVPLVNVGIPYVTDDIEELHQMRRSMDFFSPLHMSIGMNKASKSHI